MVSVSNIPSHQPHDQKLCRDGTRLGSISPSSVLMGSQNFYHFAQAVVASLAAEVGVEAEEKRLRLEEQPTAHPSSSLGPRNERQVRFLKVAGSISPSQRGQPLLVGRWEVEPGSRYMVISGMGVDTLMEVEGTMWAEEVFRMGTGRYIGGE